MKGWERLVIGAAALMLVAAGGPAGAAETVKIGVVQGLTGGPALVDFGESYLQGIQFAVKEYQASGGRYKVNLIVYDDEGNPQRAVSLVTRLIGEDKVPVVMGTVSSGNVFAFAPILQKAEIPLMAGPSIATDITTRFANEPKSYIFRCSMVDRNQIDALVNWSSRKYRKIALVHSTTGYGNYVVKEIREAYGKRGVQLVAVESAAPNVTDLTPQMLKIKNTGADLVLDFHESFELPLRPLAKINYHPVIAGNWGLASMKMLEILGKNAVEGTVMGQALDLGDPKGQKFDRKMRKEYGGKYRWPVVAALGYDAARLVLKAIDKAGPNPKGIRNALERIDDFDAVTGVPRKPFTPKQHEALDAEHVFLGVWRNGQVVRLKE